MNRIPDWEALHQLNFLLAPRISSPLNEALNALALAEMQREGGNSQVWQDKAKAQIANVLNLYQAWSAVVQYKNGNKLPPHAIRRFPVQSLLDWLTVQLELLPPPIAPENVTLLGNQATIQEALLLLYSAGTSQGNNVHLSLEALETGYWFRIRFSRTKPMPATYEAVLASFKTDWRSQDTLFELQMAHDFIALNDGQIQVNWSKETQLGEFAVFVARADAKSHAEPSLPVSPDVEHAKYVANITRSMIGYVSQTPVPPPTSLPEVATINLLAEPPLSQADIPTTPLTPLQAASEGKDSHQSHAEGIDKQIADLTESRVIQSELDSTRPLSKGASLLMDLRRLDAAREQLMTLEADEPTTQFLPSQLFAEDRPTVIAAADSLKPMPHSETPQAAKEMNS